MAVCQSASHLKLTIVRVQVRHVGVSNHSSTESAYLPRLMFYLLFTCFCQPGCRLGHMQSTEPLSYKEKSPLAAQQYQPSHNCVCVCSGYIHFPCLIKSTRAADTLKVS